MRLTASLLLLSSFFGLFGQNRCGVDERYFKKYEQESQSFESWLVQKADEKARRASKSAATAVEEVYRIPIVFHIVHQGEEIAVGTNLSEQILLRQVEILNEDFRRLNADTTLTPSSFLNVAADTKIEFVLAKRDPEGLPTNGIVRVRGSLNGYRYDDVESLSDERVLKSESQWPPDEYLNIYVTDLLSGFIGYARFPFVVLNGINKPNSDPLLDGVAIDYKFVGENDNTGSFESYGRTLTHEIGHYLGLRHVWGDSSVCGLDDFCADTPEQSGSYNQQCPSSEVLSCETPDMYSNYLNYTNDACMNIFTKCQMNRMRYVIESAPRVKDLISSPALEDPIQVANDLGLRRIISPLTSQCDTDVYPVIEIRNYGTNNINSTSIQLFIDGVLSETQQLTTELLPLQTEIVSFNPVVASSSQSNHYQFVIQNVNTDVDLNSENDTLEIYVDPINLANIPVLEDFETNELINTRTESSHPSNWQIVNAPFTVFENNAAAIHFDNDSFFGDIDYLLTPIVDLSAPTSAELSFDYSYYNPEQLNTPDGLIIGVSLDCGVTYEYDHIIFESYGFDLVTSNHAPEGPDDWETINLNITPFVGQQNVRFAFMALQGGNGHLYIDNIQIEPGTLKAVDLGIKTISNIPVVTCFNSVVPNLTIKNYGYEQINEFTINYSYQGIESSINRSGLTMISGDEINATVPISRIVNGAYNFHFEITDPNGQTDESVQNNSYDYTMIVDDYVEPVPTRNNFETTSQWIITTPTRTESIWNQETILGNNVLKANAFEFEELGVSHWFVSPILDMSDIDSASVVFSYAYQARSGRTDRLRVLLSQNCGNSFTTLLYDATSSELTSQFTNNSYTPALDSDWRDVFIDLSEYTGSDLVRIAFVFENGNGNNLYLDNIEFYQSSDPELLRFDDYHKVFPNPATSFFKVALNLPERMNLLVQLSDISGKIVRSKVVTNALNQNIEVDTQDLRGMYILHLRGKNINSSSRIFIQK